MADIKISGLPAATTPLAGTELLELVQGGNSTKVAASAVANTANNVRTVATGGTGASTLTGYVKGNGTSAMTAAATVPWTDVSGKPTNYGAFYDTTQQLAAANTATIILLNSTSLVDGVTLSGGSHINIPSTGVYNIQFSAQFVNTGAADVPVSIWLRKNGITDIAATCTDVTVAAKSGSINGYAVAAWNFLESLTAGDYVELVWSTTNTSAYLEYLAARTSPTRPAAPSIIVTVNQVA